MRPELTCLRLSLCQHLTSQPPHNAAALVLDLLTALPRALGQTASPSHALQPLVSWIHRQLCCADPDTAPTASIAPAMHGS